ncbi:hypothetical protein ACFYOY_13120 [Streptomyces sp. NPDC007875]|uniref:hypothetical protein n=1 Tax=Streptomyces sp. NPDC007875 TaxID=3364783 RepID=UPI0036BAAADA
MRRTIAAVILAATLPLTACSGGDSGKDSNDSKPEKTVKGGATKGASSKPMPLGKVVETVGSSGEGRMDITPSSVIWTSKAADAEPRNGMFVIVAVKDQAVGSVTAEAAMLENGGWQWVAPDGQSIREDEGEASSVQSEGFVGGGEVQPGTYKWRTVTFDLSKAQIPGTLMYVDGAGHAFKWKLPQSDAGPESKKLRDGLV